MFITLYFYDCLTYLNMNLNYNVRAQTLCDNFVQQSVPQMCIDYGINNNE